MLYQEEEGSILAFYCRGEDVLAVATLGRCQNVNCTDIATGRISIFPLLQKTFVSPKEALGALSLFMAKKYTNFVYNPFERKRGKYS